MAEQKLIQATDSQIVQAFKAICAALEVVEQANLTFSTFAVNQPAPIKANLTTCR